MKICIAQINLLNEYFFLTQGDDAMQALRRKETVQSHTVVIHAYRLITVRAGDSFSLALPDRLHAGAYNL